ncbi:MAG: right-handed parallel beta-helix repeat-containing protein [Prevotella sp.]
MPPRLSGRPLLTRTLWVDGERRQMASHRGRYVMDEIIDFDADNERVTIPSEALTRFGISSIDDAPQLEMVVHQRWAMAILRVKSILLDGDKATLTFREPESRWEFSHPWPQPVIGGEYGSSSFSLRNARQYIDDENEWWQDYADGRIYVGKDVAGHEVIFPVQNRLVTIEGTQVDRVHDIIFKNIRFAYTSWERPSLYGHVTLQGGFPIVDAYKLKEHEGLPWAPGLENQAWVARPESAVSVSWSQRVDFVGCRFEHLSSTALDYTIGCSDISICDNEFVDIGGTAILCGSFSEGPTEVHRPYAMTTAGATDHNAILNSYTERFTISRNRVTDATNEDWGCVGIGCGFVRDFRILDNTVIDVNYSGIAIGWGWTPHDTGMRHNIIANNNVHGYARMLYDAGGIYTMSAQPNSVIENNIVSEPSRAPYATNRRAFPIYFDACTDGFTVRKNTLRVSAFTPERYGYNTPGPNMVVE